MHSQFTRQIVGAITFTLTCGVPVNLPGAEATAYAAGTEKKSVASAGVVNDWLRGDSERWKDWDLGGQIRLRYEVKDDAGPFPNADFIAEGQKNDNHALLLRTKLHLGYTPAAWVNFYVEGRDSRAWFDERDPSPDEDPLDLNQAYVMVGNPKEFPLSLKVGRQEMIYGDVRFIGNGDWGNTGRSFDLAKLRFENQWLWVDGFVGRQVIPYAEEFNQSNDYDWFSGIYASSRQLFPWQETQLFFLARNYGAQGPNAVAPGVPGTPSTARDVYTIGTRLKSLPGKLQGWDYSTELAGQFGNVVQSNERRDLRSFAADITGGYTWADTWGTPRLGAGYTYASGDSDFTDDKYETFEPLFGTNHKFYGLMDLFGLRNIHIPSVSFSLAPARQLSVRVDYLWFWVADGHDLLYPETGPGRNANGYGRNPQFDTYVGSELDVVASYQPTSWAEFQLGYGHFFTGKYIEQSVESVPANGGATDADWFYVQMKLTF